MLRLRPAGACLRHPATPAIAQLVEHLTVEALQQSDGPWFDSGWPDMCSGEHCSAVYPFTWLAVAQLVNRLAVDAL